MANRPPPPNVLDFDVNNVMVKISQAGYIDVNNRQTGRLLSLQLPMFEVARSEVSLEGDWSNPDCTYTIKTRGDSKFSIALKMLMPGGDEELEKLRPALHDEQKAALMKLDEIAKEVHRQVFELKPASYITFINKAIEAAKATEIAIIESRGDGTKTPDEIDAMMKADSVFNARIMSRASVIYSTTNPGYGIPKMSDFDLQSMMSKKVSEYTGMSYGINLKLKRKVYTRVRNADNVFDKVDASKLPSSAELPSTVANWQRIQDKMSLYYKYNPFVFVDPHGTVLKTPTYTDPLTGITIDSPDFTPFKRDCRTYIAPTVLIDYSHGPSAYGCSAKPCNPIVIHRNTKHTHDVSEMYSPDVSTFSADDFGITHESEEAAMEAAHAQLEEAKRKREAVDAQQVDAELDAMLGVSAKRIKNESTV